MVHQLGEQVLRVGPRVESPDRGALLGQTAKEGSEATNGEWWLAPQGSGEVEPVEAEEVGLEQLEM